MYFNYYFSSNYTEKQFHFQIVLTLQLDVLVGYKSFKR